MPAEFLQYRIDVLNRFRLEKIELAQGNLTILRLAYVYKNWFVFIKVLSRVALFHFVDSFILVQRKLRRAKKLHFKI